MKKIGIAVSFFMLFLVFDYSLAQKIPSDKIYKQMSSRHFTIIYYSERTRPEKILLIAENVHNRLVVKFHINPDIHSFIILIDNHDKANGLSTILPRNTIILYDIPPELSTGFSILNYYSWLEELITHEYVHILHMNQRKDIYEPLSSIGFKYLSPNIFLPLSSLEGVAVCMETAYTPMGRARSSYAEMVLRTAVYENDLPSIDEISTFANKLPGGIGPYIWGGMFHYYLYNKVSEDKLLSSYEENGGCLSPTASCFQSGLLPCTFSCLTLFPVNSIMKNKSGMSFYQHYDEWIYYIRKKYRREISQIKEPTIPVLYEKTRGFWKISDMKYYQEKIYISGNSPHTGYGLYEYDLKSGKFRIIVKDMLISSFTFNKENIYFSGMEVFNNVYLYYVLYQYNLQTGKIKQLEEIKRIIYIQSVGENFLIVVNTDRGKEVQLIDFKGKKLKTLLKFTKDESVSDMAVLNQNEFYFVYKKENDFHDIYYYDIQNDELKRITTNPSIELSLFLEGDNLFFMSDYNSRFNIFQYSIKEKSFIQRTDFISGAVRFIKRDEDFYAIYYRSDGYTLACIDSKKMKNIKTDYNKTESFFNFTPDESGIQLTDIPVSDESRFSSIKNLFSSVLVIPSLTATAFQVNLGLFLLFNDVMLWNSLLMQVEYNSTMKKASGLFHYANSFNKIGLLLNGSTYYDNDPENISTIYDENIIIRGNDILQFEIDFWKNKFFQSASFFIGASYLERKYYLYMLRTGDTLHIGDQSYNFLFTGFKIKNSISYAYSIIPEKGWIITGQYSLSKKWLGSYYNVDLLDISITKYQQTIFRHHILQFYINAGFLLNSTDYQPYIVKGSDIIKRLYLPALYEKNLKAYRYYSEKGKNYGIGNLSYNFPLVWIEKGIKNMPVFLSHIWMKLYYEAGNSYNNIKNYKPLQVIGSELFFNFDIYFRVKIDFVMGVSHELERQKQDYYYFYFNLPI